jgi:adenosylhomocysteine nucleosidase
MTPEREVLAVVGMTREAKILASAPVLVAGVCPKELPGELERKLSAAIDRTVAGVISFGLCGALDPALKVGDLVIGAAAVGADGDLIACDVAWTQRLAAALPQAKQGRFAAAPAPVPTREAKATLREQTGAVAVDLESYAAARQARAFRLPFAILRAVSDDAGRALPPAAQVGLGADGRPSIGAVLGSLKSNPWQIGALIRTALEAEDAFHALERARHALGPRLAGPEG